jgi:hypothetical protein
MPVNNKRSYNGNNESSNSRRESGSRGSGRSNSRGASKFKKGGDFNMLNLITAFGDILDWQGNMPGTIKVRAMLKADRDKNQINVVDEQENEYTPEEAVALLADALLNGRALNFYLKLNDDDSFGGNGRINILGLEVAADEEEEKAPAPKKAPAKKAVAKRDYETDVRKASADDDDEEDDELPRNQLPF